jgi:ankyrin repeat protein
MPEYRPPKAPPVSLGTSADMPLGRPARGKPPFCFERGNRHKSFVLTANGRGFEGRTPVANRAEPKTEEFASGWLTPLMLATREDDLEMSRILVNAGADVNAVAGDGKTPLALAIFNGNYDVASLLIDSKADVNRADAQRFTPLFWAVDRRNMETAPNFPWMVTADPMLLIRKLLDAGALGR